MKNLNEKGMTLIEVIISMAIMAMVLVPLTSILMSTYKINAQSQNNMEAKSAAMMVIDAIEEDIRLAKGIKIYPYTAPSLNDGESKIYFEAEQPDNPDDPHNTDLIKEEKTSTGTTAKTLVADNLFYNKAHRIEFVKKGGALLEIKVTIGKYPEQDLDDPDIDKYTMTKTIKLVQPIQTGTSTGLIDDSLIVGAGLTSGTGIVITKF